MSTTVSGFILTIDDARSEGFLIEIGDDLFKVDNFTLTQDLMQPNTLTFSMRKGPREDGSETQFKTCGDIIGKDLSLSLETENFETISALRADGDKTGDITFKGIITSVSGSRSQSEYVLEVEAKSYDALLIDNAACKSYENKTLNEIVEDVTEDYADLISPEINAGSPTRSPTRCSTTRPTMSFSCASPAFRRVDLQRRRASRLRLSAPGRARGARLSRQGHTVLQRRHENPPHGVQPCRLVLQLL